MSMESTEPYIQPEPTEPSTPPGPMTTTSREMVPITRKATKSRSKTKAKKVWLPKVKEENLQQKYQEQEKTKKEKERSNKYLYA
jgi:hypothetical protein